MSSVGQIVRQIIEQLSDGVSQLVLMVVVLQEQNADVPPNLPTAAGAVSQTAATLAKVAQQLAVTSYKNFEEISSEIVVSATAVQDANATMQTAMQSLTSSPDRKVGWAGLVESCRIMAAKTIKLLQIVYGAELKRLFAVADGLLGDLSTFKTALAQDDPQAFADKASELASHAAQLANYVSARGKDEENPFVKAQLEQQSALLAQKADELINAVNELLTDPDNKDKASDVERLVRELQDLITATATIVRENQTDMGATDENAIPSLSKALADKKRREEEEEYQRKLADAPPGFNLFVPIDEPITRSAVENKIQWLKEAALTLANSAATSRAAESAKAADELNRALQDVKAESLAFAKVVNDPARSRAIEDTLKTLEALASAEMLAAKKALENPSSDNKDAVKARAQEVRRVADQLREETKPSLHDNINRAKDLIAKLVVSVKAKDDKSIADLLRQLRDIANDIESASKWQAQNTADPNKAKEIADLLARLNALGLELNGVAKAKDATQTQIIGTKYVITLDELAKATNAEALAALDNVKNMLKKIETTAVRGDPKALQFAAKMLLSDTKDMLQKARDAASKIADPQQRARILEAISALEGLMADQLKNINILVQNPNDEKAKEAIARSNKNLLDALAGLEGALGNSRTPTVVVDGLGVADPAATSRAIDDLIAQLKRMDELQARLRVNPNDKAAQAELKALLEQLDKTSGGLLGAVSKSPEDVVEAKAEEFKMYADELAQAVLKSDQRAAAEASKKLMKASKELAELLRAETGRVEDPALKQDLENAAKAIEVTATNALKHAKESLDAASDENKRIEALKSIETTKRAADHGSDLLHPIVHDERELRERSKDIAKLMVAVETASKRGDKGATDASLRKLESETRRFLRAAEKRHPRLHPEDQKEDPLAELRRLWNTIGHPARELAQAKSEGKNNADAQAKLEITVRDATNSMNKVMETNNVPATSTVQDALDTLNKLQSALDRGDTTAVSTEARSLVGKANALVPLAQNETDPEKQAKLIDLVNEFNPAVKQALADVAESLKNPNDTTKREKVKEDIAAARVPLTKIMTIFSPHSDRPVIETIRAAEASNRSLQTALTTEDPAAIAAKKAELKKLLESAIDGVKTAIANETDPTKKKKLEEQLRGLQGLLASLNKPGLTVPELNRLCLNIGSALNDLVGTLGGDRVDDVAKARGKAAALAARMKELMEAGDINGMMLVAQELADYLRGMMDDAGNLARLQRGGNLSEQASAALALDDLLRQIESNNVTSGSGDLANIGSLLDSLGKLAANEAPKDAPNTFEAVLEEAADTIAEAVREAKTDNTASLGVVDELKRLAAAARAGQRQAMLISSRAVAAHITSVTQQMQDVIKKMGQKNPKEQERLHKASQALRNYATQLKILTSVKAASIEKDADSDESLFSVTRGLGYVLGEAVGVLDIVKITVLKEKPSK